MGQNRVFEGRMSEIRVAEFPIEEILKGRRSATRNGIVAIVCFEIIWFAIYHTYQYAQARNYRAFATAAGTLVLAYLLYDTALYARSEFMKAWAMFYGRRYLQALDTLQAEGYRLGRINPKNFISKWEFYWAKDLKQFEQSLFDYLRSFRRAEDLYQRQVKWAATNAKLIRQLETLFEEYNVTGTRREEVMEEFSSHHNPERRKQFIASYRSRIVHERWVALNTCLLDIPGAHHRTEYPTGNEEDFRLKHLEKEASRVTSLSARYYYEQGLSTESRREKIRFFKRALSEDVGSAAINGEAAAAAAALAKTPNEAVVAEVKHLSLQEFARERLTGLRELVRGTDWRMHREIILSLARPGQSGGRFNKHYFAEDTVKRMVRRQCNMYGDFTFKPAIFDQAVSWLIMQGVLVTKPKVDERTLSLSTNAKRATPAGAQIISMVLSLKREMSGLPS